MTSAGSDCRLCSMMREDKSELPWQAATPSPRQQMTSCAITTTLHHSCHALTLCLVILLSGAFCQVTPSRAAPATYQVQKFSTTLSPLQTLATFWHHHLLPRLASRRSNLSVDSVALSSLFPFLKQSASFGSIVNNHGRPQPARPGLGRRPSARSS